MIKWIMTIFKGKNAPKAKGYTGFSDFFLNAPLEEQKKVIAEAAQNANEDQLTVFAAARLNTKVD